MTDKCISTVKSVVTSIASYLQTKINGVGPVERELNDISMVHIAAYVHKRAYPCPWLTLI